MCTKLEKFNNSKIDLPSKKPKQNHVILTAIHKYRNGILKENIVQLV